ncbi:hypothetical protein UZ36_06635 [Candidatus Nitromaritima sp. SCGC AAA799-C22]|nr:hypothetical protein UZ36_06635 [Candidatus Nitromaritima sp. SCGC AAA799-C22]
MSLIDRKNLNYFTIVEQFFLSLKDSGLALSANDYQLIGQWEERGIPVELVCRAIETGFSRQEGSRGRKISLTQLETIVEEEIQTEIRKG